MKTNALSNVGSVISKTASKTSMKVQKHSPEILLAAGIVGFVGTVVLASRAVLSAQEVMEEHKDRMKDIREAKKIAEENPGEYDYNDDLVKQDKVIAYTKTAVGLAKTYAPVVAMGGFSIACILVSRNILHKRYLGAVAAYNTVSNVFEQYRQRVRDEQGEIMDRHFRYGTELEEVETTVVDEDGKKKKVKEVVEKIDPAKQLDDTSRFFDSRNKNWDKNRDFNLMFIRGQQNYMNDILQTRGHVFLNEVYDALGFEQTQQGCVTGWILGEDSDNYIDFGLFGSEKNRKFTNGDDGTILLEFNHDGLIWDKI